MLTAATLDIDHAYEVFRRSYEAETGTAWTKDKFLKRARQWIFYGDQNGFVAIRPQRSGLHKLVGIAGAPRSILKALAELQKDPTPLWGAVSASLAQMAAKRGMIVPHLYRGGPLLIRTLMPLVPASVFGGETPELTKDGGLVFHYSDTGRAVKYLIGNKNYFLKMLGMQEVAQRLNAIPGINLLLRLMGLR